jgi:hypothetical protein
MSISAMKQALEALEYYRSAEDYQPTPASEAITALRQAIAEAEKQEPVLDSSYPDGDGYWNVHASDISQECADETAKYRHEWVGQPDLARVGEVGIWGEEKNT